MSVKSMYCKQCKTFRAFEKKEVNHVVHAVLTLLTCFWGLVWIIACIENKGEKYQSRECGMVAEE